MADSLPLPDLPDIVQRYLNGESMQTIGRDYRRTRHTIANWLHNATTDAQYPDLIRQGILQQLIDAEIQMEEASDSLSIARARELLRHRQWLCERRLKMFSPKHELEVDNKITVVINRLGPQQVVVGQGQGETVEGEVKDIKALEMKSS